MGISLLLFKLRINGDYSFFLASFLVDLGLLRLEKWLTFNFSIDRRQRFLTVLNRSFIIILSLLMILVTLIFIGELYFKLVWVIKLPNKLLLVWSQSELVSIRFRCLLIHSSFLLRICLFQNTLPLHKDFLTPIYPIIEWVF